MSLALAAGLLTYGAINGEATSATALRFGIDAGATERAATSYSTASAGRALRELRSGGVRGPAPFVVRLYASFSGNLVADGWSGSGANAGVGAQVESDTANGLLVDLVLRYQPAPDLGNASVVGFDAFVRHTVARYARNPRVRFLQITNEADVAGSPSSADGAYAGVVQALVTGTEAAASAAWANGASHLAIGFNWAYQAGGPKADAFWSTLRAGGQVWAQSVQWVGIDDDPGPLGAPTVPPDQIGPALASAIVTLRNFMSGVGLGHNVPVHVTEVGYPTGPRHSWAAQATALSSVVRTIYKDRLALNVTDLRWFELRDDDGAIAGQRDQYGVMTGAYLPKPAFWTYRALIASDGH